MITIRCCHCKGIGFLIESVSCPDCAGEGFVCLYCWKDSEQCECAEPEVGKK